MPSSENTNTKPVNAMTDFPGLILNADPRDIPPGAGQQQVNASSEQAGVLQSRRGMRPVRFEGE